MVKYQSNTNVRSEQIKYQVTKAFERKAAKATPKNMLVPTYGSLLINYKEEEIYQFSLLYD